VVTRDRTYTADEFYDLVAEREDDRRFELIEGYVVEMAPPRSINSYIAMLIGIHLGTYVLENDLGYVFGADGGYILRPGDVRVPYASFVIKERITGQMPKWIEGAPDLAIEVISPSESSTVISRKTHLYFDSGAQVVWLIHPDDKFAEVCVGTEDGHRVTRIGEGGNLTAPSIFPDFELPLHKILPPPDLFQTDEET